MNQCALNAACRFPASRSWDQAVVAGALLIRRGMTEHATRCTTRVRSETHWLRFKFAGALHVATALSQILIEAFRRHFQPADFDLIVPVPIHRRRLIHRGFNQVVVLAEKLSQDTGIPLDRTSFKKIKDTPPQVGLTRPARVKNLRGSFGIQRSNRIRGRKVLLVDDVATTGSTIAEAAKTIMRGGAARVDVLVLAVRMEVSRPAEYHATPATSEQLITDKSSSSEDHQ